MDEKKQADLTDRQIALLDDLFSSKMSEEGSIKKHKVSSQLYRQWLNDDAFADEFEFRMTALERRNRLIVAKFAPYAAVKLIDQMESDKPENVRKACLEIISYCGRSVVDGPGKTEIPNDAAGQFDAEVAGRLLEILAEGK